MSTFRRMMARGAALLAAVPLGAALGQSPAPAAPEPAPAAADLEPAVDTSARATKRAPPPARAADRVELEATQITGNRELPKVLYIVPWKRSDLGDLAGKPVNSLLDEVLAPVDREVFRRQNRYYEALRPNAMPDGEPTGEARPAPDGPEKQVAAKPE